MRQASVHYKSLLYCIAVTGDVPMLAYNIAYLFVMTGTLPLTSGCEIRYNNEVVAE